MKVTHLAVVIAIIGLGTWYQERTDPPVTTAVEVRTVEPLIATTVPEPVIVTTTTLPPVESARVNLNIALSEVGGERAALTALAAAYEAMARALDDNDQAALIALWTAHRIANRLAPSFGLAGPGAMSVAQIRGFVGSGFSYEGGL